MDEYERREILQMQRGVEATVARDVVEVVESARACAPHAEVRSGGQVANNEPMEPPMEPDIKQRWVGIRGLDASVTG